MKIKDLEAVVWVLGAAMMAASGIILGNAGINNSAAGIDTQPPAGARYVSSFNAKSRTKSKFQRVGYRRIR